ncbi:MAG: ABC transporter permease [Thermomicrobiales bacterium]|nr:ABC transporter permease [Thermomicrobiales bacterium]
MLEQTWAYIVANQDRVQDALFVHIGLSAAALLLATLIFIPLGVVASRGGPVTTTVVGAVAAVRVIPSLAVILLLLPVFGLGWKPALVALTLLAGPPLVLNTDAGLRGVDPATLEAATGLGMTNRQRFWRVHVPLALPIIVAGLRTAAVEVIGSATLAAFVGAGGLGDFITSGITLMDERMLLTGAILVTLLALLTEVTVSLLERRITPPRTNPA